MKLARNAAGVLVLSLLLFPAAGLAQDLQTIPIGLRGGLTSWGGLTQLHLGVHADLGEVVPNVVLIPNFEIGIGDDHTVMAFNGDLAYRFTELVSSPWGLYGGGCLSFIVVDGPGDGSTTDLGMSALAGMTYLGANGHTTMMEFRFGLLDSPDFKLTVGYSLF